MREPSWLLKFLCIDCTRASARWSRCSVESILWFLQRALEKIQRKCGTRLAPISSFSALSSIPQKMHNLPRTRKSRGRIPRCTSSSCARKKIGPLPGTVGALCPREVPARPAPRNLRSLNGQGRSKRRCRLSRMEHVSFADEQAMETAPSQKSSSMAVWTKPNTIALFTIAGILLHLLLRYLLHASRFVWLAPLVVVLVAGGVPLLVPLTRKLFAREFGSDHLAGISIVTSVILGEYLVAAIVILMLSGGTALEEFASRRASSVLDALAKRMPQVAHRKSGGALADVKLADVAVGDMLVILPHEICPVDGVVVEGHGRMNEAYLTGEPFEIAKTPGSEVLSGSINGDAALHIRAEKLAIDSRYARIMRVMQDAEQRRPRLRRLGDKLGAWYTPVALSLAGIAWAASGESHRFLAVLVVATPCPLLISIPVAVIGAISLCARRGIIVKNPAALEQIDRCRTLIFDKTGTLTYGKPSLSEILCAPGFAKDEVLRLAASLENYSKHPLSQAILEAATKANLALALVSEVSERPGEGLKGTVGQHSVWITNRKKVIDKQLALPPVAPGLECLLFVD